MITVIIIITIPQQRNVVFNYKTVTPTLYFLSPTTTITPSIPGSGVSEPQLFQQISSTFASTSPPLPTDSGDGCPSLADHGDDDDGGDDTEDEQGDVQADPEDPG
jgi:hypothetical protein